MSRELLKRALKELLHLQFANDSAVKRHNDLIADIKAELEKPEHEPIAYGCFRNGVMYDFSRDAPGSKFLSALGDYSLPLFANYPRQQAPVGYANVAELDRLKDHRISGRSVFVSKEESENRVAIYTCSPRQQALVRLSGTDQTLQDDPAVQKAMGLIDSEPGDYGSVQGTIERMLAAGYDLKSSNQAPVRLSDDGIIEIFKDFWSPLKFARAIEQAVLKANRLGGEE